MKKLLSVATFYGLAVFLCTSCSIIPGEKATQQAETIEPVTCIAVLPATSSGKEKTIDYADAQALENGAGQATRVLNNELKGNSKIRILSFSQVSSFSPEFTGGEQSLFTAIRQKTHCEGILLTTVRRYRQRQGTEYSADSPASVDLSMVLKHAETGAVLWSADYTEEQESLLNNLFTFNKAQKRGFKWISVEQLMEQGIKERLAECPYLN